VCRRMESQPGLYLAAGNAAELGQRNLHGRSAESGPPSCRRGVRYLGVQPRERATAFLQPANLPDTLFEPAAGRREPGRFLGNQTLTNHRTAGADLPVRVLQQHQSCDHQSAGPFANVVDVRKDSVASKYAAENSDGAAAGVLRTRKGPSGK